VPVALTVVANEYGEVVDVAFERQPAGAVAGSVEARRAGEVRGMRIRRPDVLRELGVEPDDVGSVEILRLAAGEVAADPASVIWVELKSDTQRAAEEALAAARAEAGEVPLAGTRVRLRSQADPAADPATMEPRREAEVRAVLERRAAGEAAGGSEVRLRTPLDPANGPLYVIDGVVVSPESMDLVRELDPATIDRIEVVKGAAAERLFGARGAKGVIRITTKRAPPEL
jgi:TonB-dependent SusC/RagA subfamily outer membrane receptor